VRPEGVIQGIEIGLLAVGGTDERNDDGARCQNGIGYVNPGKQARAVGVHVAQLPFSRSVRFFQRYGRTAPVAGQQQCAFIRVGLFRVSQVLGIVEGQGRAVIRQIAQAGKAAAGQDELAQVSHLGHHDQQVGFTGSSSPVWPEKPDHIECIQ